MIQHFTGTYYDILEVKKDAPQNEISRAYERAKITYSTENPALYTVFSIEEARQLTQVIEEAFAILGNNVFRTRYDDLLNDPTIDHGTLNYHSIVGTTSINPTSLDKQKVSFKSSYSRNDAFENEIQKTSIWDGTMIKKVREYKNISVEKMCEITRINQSYLLSIEKNDWKNLPVPVFIRGFIIQIARVLNLDEKKVADSFMNFYKQQVGKS